MMDKWAQQTRLDRMPPRLKAIVVGAGVGGLSAAALLARTCDVTVFERAGGPGGKIRQQATAAGPVDCGPTVFTMRWVFDALFAEAGEAFEDHVTLAPLDILARHAWPGGATLDLYADPDRTADAIAGFASRRDADAYRGFIQDAERVFKRLEAAFLMRSSPDLLGLVASGDPFHLAAIKPFMSYARHLEGVFKDARLRQLFGRYATYCGASPYEAPATLRLIAHVEQAGVWSPRGGMAALARALETVAVERGAAFRYEAHVEEILLEAGRACGVALAGGEVRRADIVIFNGDVAALSAGLLGERARGPAGRARASSRATRSQSAITFTVAGQATDEALSAHTVFFSEDYAGEFEAVFKRGAPPRAPTTYVFAPWRSSSGPRGKGPEPLFFLVNAPATGDARPFHPREVEACRQAMMAQIEACGARIEPAADDWTATSPADFAQRFPGTGGALYGPAGHGWRASFQRSGVRSRVRGLYLAGGSVHPGPGVPMAALSGQAAARAALADFGLTCKSRQGAIVGGT